MAFEWYDSHIPQAVRDAGAKRHEAMYLDEARYRAALLRRLGFSKEAARDRIERSLGWGFEVNGKPAFLKKIGKVIDEVYGRG